MAKIYLIRHGESIYNATGICQGHKAIPLSKKGITQSRKLSESLKDMRFEKIYSSDLTRAIETAKIISENQNAPVSISEDLREFGKGVGEGYSHDFLTRNFGKIKDKDYTKAGGEDKGIVRERVENFLKSLRIKKDGKIAIVTHGGVKKTIFEIMGLMDWKDMEDIRMENTGVSIIEIKDGKASLISLNSSAHLG